MHTEISTPQERHDLDISYSNGRGKYGKQYVYFRPAKKCFNRSRRTTPDRLLQEIAKHFPQVFYFLVCGKIIGAKDAKAALREYWRVCERDQIGQPFEVKPVEDSNEAERQIIPARSLRHAAEMDRQLQQLQRDTIRWKQEIFKRVFSK